MEQNAHTFVSLGDLICAFKYQSLSRVKLSLIRQTGSLASNADTQNFPSIRQSLVSVFKKRDRIFFHRSLPSLRISRMSGEFMSRQLPAG